MPGSGSCRTPFGSDGGKVGGRRFLRWPGHRGRSAAEARRRGRLHHTFDLDEGAARLHVRMPGRFGKGRHRRKADIGIFEQVAPLLPCARLEALRDLHLGLRPGATVVLAAERLGIEVQLLQQQCIEARFDRANRNSSAVLAFVDLVEGRAGVQDVGAAPLVPQASGMQAVERGGQRGRAVDDGGIDDLPLPGAARFQQRRQNALAK